MFLINDKTNNFLSKQLTYVLSQNNQNITVSKSVYHFAAIDLFFEGENICLSFESKKLISKTPISFHDFHEKLLLIISDYKISFQEFDYFPLQQKVFNKTLMKKLTFTHSIILNKLILSKDGIKKNDLYKTIWPGDKEIFSNKLDTHLTNLKNIFNNELKCSLNYFSKNGLLRLLIN